LELMHMRMPDRLQYAIHLDPAASALACPTMMLLTLVENAIRHGIDPSEEGGRIDVDVWIRDGRCRVRESIHPHRYVPLPRWGRFRDGSTPARKGDVSMWMYGFAMGAVVFGSWTTESASRNW